MWCESVELWDTASGQHTLSYRVEQLLSREQRDNIDARTREEGASTGVRRLTYNQPFMVGLHLYYALQIPSNFGEGRDLATKISSVGSAW